jgi:endogenous inhibitor of DNA gyrase (YacG/DUF329 family)
MTDTSNADQTSEAPNDPQHACPVCERDVEPREDNPSFPFCSKRCKQVDLGRWFNEEVSIPMTPNSTERSLNDTDTED